MNILPNKLNLNEYYKLKLSNLTDEYLSRDPEDLFEEGFKSALNLFYEVAERVPAYNHLLKSYSVSPKSIRRLADFKKLPIINKKNYLSKYPLKDFYWDGIIKNRYIISSSSGSTGIPFLWPRGEEQELEGAIMHELIFKEIFHSDKKSTLYVNCFSQGIWVAGHFSLACVEYLAKKGYNISTINPGLDTNVTLMLLKNLASEFDQIVLSGYPPLIKDLLDIGVKTGINWKTYDIKFLFAAEGFSELWRAYIHKTVGKKEQYTTSINIYGSADAAALAHETPLSIAIRQKICTQPRYMKELFGDMRIPTLAQYDPRFKFFESVNNSLVFTTRAGLPLIRYEIGDNGGIYTFSEMQTKLQGINLDFNKLNHGFNNKYLWKLPFVYVFGRSDLTVSYYGLLIYPEHIKYGLEKSTLQKYITGKFVMSVDFSQKQDPYLYVRVELAEGVIKSKYLIRLLTVSITNGLKKINTEYNKLYQTYKDRVIPNVELIENANNEYFQRGIKQRWVKNN